MTLYDSHWSSKVSYLVFALVFKYLWYGILYCVKKVNIKTKVNVFDSAKPKWYPLSIWHRAMVLNTYGPHCACWYKFFWLQATWSLIQVQVIQHKIKRSDLSGAYIYWAWLVCAVLKYAELQPGPVKRIITDPFRISRENQSWIG